MDLPERIKTVRESLGLSQKDMAKAINASLPSIQNYEAGKSVPGGDVIKSLVKLGFNANWLLTGEGTMRLEEGSIEREGSRPRVDAIGGEPVPVPEHERLDRGLLEITIARLQQVFSDFDITDPHDQAGVITDVYSHVVEKNLQRDVETVDGLAKTMNSLFSDLELLKRLPSLGLGFLSRIPKQLLGVFKK